MKYHAPFVAIALVAQLSAAEVPKVFAGLFEQDVPVKGQIGVVMPPKEIDPYIAKVEKAARADPKWFREFSASARPGAPLPYDEKLGLTKTEYDEYMVLWNKREFKPMEEIIMVLRPSAGDTWTLTSTGGASVFSTLRYSAETGSFRSPNGELKRLDDINADSTSILGEWSGAEWRFEEDTGLGKIKENVAVGRFGDKKHGILVYRAQELSTEGTRLLDKSLVIRFALGKAGQAKIVDPTAATDSKPAAPKTATPKKK